MTDPLDFARVALIDRRMANPRTPPGDFIVPVIDPNLWLGLDGDGFRMLLRSDADPGRGPTKPPDLLRLRQTIRTLDSSRRPFLEVSCASPALSSIFDHFCASVTDEVGLRPDEPLAALSDVLQRWQDLLKASAAPVLGANAVAGLIGELLIMEQIAVIDAAAAVAAWTGTDKARHDFRAGQHAIEVKTVTSATSLIVEIHGITQLQAPTGGDLHVAVVRLERNPGGDVTLASVVARLLAHPGVPKETFLAHLTAAGVPLAHVDLLSHYRFSDPSVIPLPVTDDFPALTERSLLGGRLPAGVDALTYRVDVSLALHRELSEDEWAAVCRALAGDVR